MISTECAKTSAWDCGATQYSKVLKWPEVRDTNDWQFQHGLRVDLDLVDQHDQLNIDTNDNSNNYDTSKSNAIIIQKEIVPVGHPKCQGYHWIPCSAYGGVTLPTPCSVTIFGKIPGAPLFPMMWTLYSPESWYLSWCCRDIRPVPCQCWVPGCRSC